MARFKTEIPGRYSGDGSLKQYIIPFPYQHRSQVKVEVWDDVTSKWIEIQQGPKGYEFINDNLIQFFIAPKKSTALYNIQITRNTRISEMLKEFPTNRDAACSGDSSGLSSCTEPDSSPSDPPIGEDPGPPPIDPDIPDTGPKYGKLLSPDRINGRPPIPDDELIYFHPCKGPKDTYYPGYGSPPIEFYTAPAVVKWYRKHPDTGVNTLIEEQLEGLHYDEGELKRPSNRWKIYLPKKLFKYEVKEEDIGYQIFVTVQCYGCGPEKNGLCKVQYGGRTLEVHGHTKAGEVVPSSVQNPNARRLIPVGPGYGIIEVNVNPGVNKDRFVFGGALEEDTGQITSNTQTGTTFKYTKKNEKNFVTVEVLPKTVLGTFNTTNITLTTETIIVQSNLNFEVNDPVRFSISGTGALPQGLSANTTYYVIAYTPNSGALKVSATLGGSAVNLIDVGTANYPNKFQVVYHADVLWEYTVNYTKKVDTTQYKYARWVGKKITHQGAYIQTIGQGQEIIYNPVHSEENYTSPWYDYSSNNDPAKRYLTIQGMSECGTSGNPIVEAKGINPEAEKDPTYKDDWAVFGLIQSNNTLPYPWRSKVWAVNWGEFKASDFPGLTLGGLGNGTTGSPCGDNPEPKLTIPDLVGSESIKYNWYNHFVEDGEFIDISMDNIDYSQYKLDYTTSTNSYVALEGYWEFSNSEEETKEVHAAWDGVGYQEYAYFHSHSRTSISSARDAKQYLDMAWRYVRKSEEDAWTPWNANRSRQDDSFQREKGDYDWNF